MSDAKPDPIEVLRNARNLNDDEHDALERVLPLALFGRHVLGLLANSSPDAECDEIVAEAATMAEGCFDGVRAQHGMAWVTGAEPWLEPQPQEPTP